MSPKNVLLIEDSAEYRENIELMLADDDHSLSIAACPAEAFELLKKDPYDVIICDLHLPFTLTREIKNFPYSIEVGIRTINELREVFPDTPIIGISASMPSDMPRIAEEINFVPLLNKPFSRTDLLDTISRASNKDSQLLN